MKPVLYYKSWCQSYEAGVIQPMSSPLAPTTAFPPAGAPNAMSFLDPASTVDLEQFISDLAAGKYFFGTEYESCTDFCQGNSDASSSDPGVDPPFNAWQEAILWPTTISLSSATGFKEILTVLATRLQGWIMTCNAWPTTDERLAFIKRMLPPDASMWFAIFLWILSDSNNLKAEQMVLLLHEKVCDASSPFFLDATLICLFQLKEKPTRYRYELKQRCKSLANLPNVSRCITSQTDHLTEIPIVEQFDRLHHARGNEIPCEIDFAFAVCSPSFHDHSRNYSISVRGDHPYFSC
jgi:hypothetical protein